jgi:hypothetical protein
LLFNGGLHFGRFVVKFDDFKLEIDLFPSGLFVDGQHFVDLHLVLLNSDAVDVLVSGLQQTPPFLQLQ